MTILGRVKLRERYELEVPGNGIDHTGVLKIVERLQARSIYTLSPDTTTDGWEWVWRVGGKGEYVGTLPKRIAKWVYQQHQIKLPAEEISEIGNIAAEHCDKTQTYYFDFTDRLNWSDGDFGDHGSCIMSSDGCHKSARDTIEENGCWAMRFYEGPGKRGVGRAWVYDFGKYCVLFNGYWSADSSCSLNHNGSITAKLARILSQWLDNAYYHRVSLRCSADSMYINGCHGIAIGPQDVVAPMTAARLEWEDAETDSSVECDCCGERGDEDDMYRVNGSWYCSSCYRDHYTPCCHCGRDIETDCGDATYCNDEAYCQRCADRYLRWCEHCEEYYREHDCTHADMAGGAKWFCDDCLAEHYRQCFACDEYVPVDDAKEGEDSDELYCESCWDDKFQQCALCDAVTEKTESGYCRECDGPTDTKPADEQAELPILS